VPAFPDKPTDEIAAALGSVPIGTAVSTVAKRLLDLFTSGSIPAGSRLPPERELAQTLNIGRSAVREALAALEILGVVDVRPGSGTYLRGSVSELLPETLNWGLMLGEPRTRELIAVRGRLEVFAAELAAARIDDDALARLAGHLTAMRESGKDRVRFVEADVKFHVEIARVAGNEVLAGLLQSIRSLLRVWVERALHSEDEAAAALAEHTAVYEAIASRDSAAARAAMESHMTTAGARLSGTLTAEA
jgi:GntR family transcriptional repressor for pyruvate dehydrogenase complex